MSGATTIPRLVLTLAYLLALGAMTSAPRHPAYAQASRGFRTYSVGWNLIAAPPGTDLSQVEVLYTLQAGETDYESVDAAQPTMAGYGYWAYLAPSTASDTAMLTLAPGSSTPYTVHAPPGQPTMIGNPSGLWSATIRGVSAAYTFDPATGYQPATALRAGQGAWAVADDGGTITVSPISLGDQPTATGYPERERSLRRAPAGPPATGR